MNESPSIEKISPALVKALGGMPILVKDETGQVGQQKTRYASLDAVMDVVRPVLSENELCVLTFPMRAPSGYVGIRARFLHSSGEFMEEEFEIPAANGSQGYGSGLTYGRRYAVMAMCGLAPEDDDGAAAMPNSRGNSRTTQQQDRPANRNSTPPPAGRSAGYTGADPDESSESHERAGGDQVAEPAATPERLRSFFIKATGRGDGQLGYSDARVHQVAGRESLTGITVRELNILWATLKQLKESGQPLDIERAPAGVLTLEAPPEGVECEFCNAEATRMFGLTPCCGSHAPTPALLAAAGGE